MDRGSEATSDALNTGTAAAMQSSGNTPGSSSDLGSAADTTGGVQGAGPGAPKEKEQAPKQASQLTGAGGKKDEAEKVCGG